MATWVPVWLRPSLVAEELGSAMAQLGFSLGSAPVLDGTVHARVLRKP